MKKALIFFSSLLLLNVIHAQELKTHEDSLSYAVGVLWGQNIKQQGLSDISGKVAGLGIHDVLVDNALKMDIKLANEFVKDHVNQKKEMDKTKNLTEGRIFLETNSNRKGVITLPSGLQYEVLTKGTGAKPTANDKVTVHYQGTLIDGTVFDSSVQRGQPATFPVTGVIKGWVEALQLMEVGSKWKLFIPADLAYGDRGAGAMIGPFATLVFEVELLGIEN